MNNGYIATDTFVESPIFDNWFKKHYPQKSFLVCSPYIKKDALDRIISLYDLNNRDDDFDFKVLIRGNENEFTYQKSSDISAFDSLICLNNFNLNNVKRITNLHMKAYLIDGTHLLITSGNLTTSGMFVLSGKENFEGGISTTNPDMISNFLKYFSSIWEQGDVLNDFYDDLMLAYANYIKTEYSDKGTLARLNRRKYNFKAKSKLDNAREPIDTSNASTDANTSEATLSSGSLTFTLNDIPPVGHLAHLPATLKAINEAQDGITYLDLGKKLRPIFSDDKSVEINAYQKFGEEKGKFASFLNLATIEPTGHGNLIKITNFGKTYLSLDDESKNKLIKDVFFDKPIIVSILKQSRETPDFDLKKFLLKNCMGKNNQAAKESTISRKISPIKELLSHISSICTDDELKTMLSNV